MSLYHAESPLRPAAEHDPLPLSDADRLMSQRLDLEIQAMTHASTAQEYRGQIPSMASYSSETFLPNKYASSKIIPRFVKLGVASLHERKAEKLGACLASLSVVSMVEDLETK